MTAIKAPVFTQCRTHPRQVVRRTWDWLAEQPEDAAELAVLLYEAAPKLNISSASAGGASRKVPTRSP